MVYFNRLRGITKVSSFIVSLSMLIASATAAYGQFGVFGNGLSDEAPTPPVHLSAGPLFPNSFHTWSFDAEIDTSRVIRLFMTDSKGSGTVSLGETISATISCDDYIFTASKGSPTIDVSLNLEVRGSATHIVPSLGTTRVSLGVQWPQGGNSFINGTWHATQGAVNPPSTGMFVGENNLTIDGVFTTNWYTVPTGVAVSLTVVVFLQADVSGTTPGSATGNFRDGNNLVRLGPDQGPIFNFRNLQVDETVCAVSPCSGVTQCDVIVSTEKSTWGRMKALFQ